MNYPDIIAKMTLEEKAYLLSGKDFWSTRTVERLGVPSITLSDGPHGVRRQEGAGDQLGLNGSLPATCFPTAATIANSWDPALGEEIGRCLGEEAACQDVGVLLGPGLNMKRSPLCGRNFEYFSEDPYLAGKMAAGYIRGIQENGVSACPKHFAANNTELRRQASDSIVDERTLRELYLTGFEIAVKEGHPRSIMSSYNAINGTYAKENEHLLQEILRDEWGFEGFVVSDWGGNNDFTEGVRAGSHLEMPTTAGDGPEKEFAALLGHPIPDGSWSGTLQLNDAICQLYYAKSLKARLVYKIMTAMLNKSIAKGEPDLNIIFVYNMPFRAIGKMAGGAVSQEMCEGIMTIVNGHAIAFLAGLGKVIGGYFRQRKVLKKAQKLK